jgi:outer membrane protein
MKHVIIRLTTVVSIMVLIFSVESTLAQNQRIGFIDTEFILSKIPEYAGVDQRLRQLVTTWNEEIAELEKEIADLQEDFRAKEILFTPEVRREREQEINNKKRELERYINNRFGPEGDYYRQQRDLLEPIQRKIVEAVGKVATRDGYDFVFDRHGDYVFFFSRPQWDLSIEVLLEMGIQVDETTVNR